MISAGRGGKVLFKCFGGCGQSDVLAALCDLGLFGRERIDRGHVSEAERKRRDGAELAAEIDRLRRRIDRARALYGRAVPAVGTPAEHYLRSRSIMLPPPECLHFLRHCPHRNGRYYAAMVAPIVNVAGEQIGLHKTYLRPDGSGKANLPKPEQRETCGPFKGGAIRLAPHRASAELLVGEGIEPTLSAMQLFGLPGWAAICAPGIEAVELPSQVRAVAIVVDNDENHVGQRASLLAFERWIAEGRAVRILLPSNPGDFNDILLRE
jgi:DNA primase